MAGRRKATAPRAKAGAKARARPKSRAKRTRPKAKGKAKTPPAGGGVIARALEAAYDPESERRYWLVKSEPEVYSIDDLRRDGRTFWSGVRNFAARNIMRDRMKVGDLVLFYHSNAEPSGAAGVCRVAREGYPDHTQFDRDARDANGDPMGFDPKSDPADPTWFMVDVEFVEKLPRLVPLAELKADRALRGMLVTTPNRLSVQPVTRAQFERVLALAREATR